MKIKTDEQVFIFPIEESINVLVDRGFREEFIECMNLYFNKKRKTKCLIYDDDNVLLKFNEIGFIFLENESMLNDNLEFKAKTDFNNELSLVIENNPEMFISLDDIRRAFKSMLSDKGMYEIKRILGYGLNRSIEIEINEFDINKILQVFAIEYEELSISEKRLIYLNLMLFINRKKVSVVYIDFEIDRVVSEWIKKMVKKGVIFIIDNNIMNENVNLKIDNVIVLSQFNSLAKLEIEKEKVKKLLYALNPIVESNLSFQSKEIVDLYKEFSDQNLTFSIKII
ncbi:MAG: hypothetical protein ACOX1L_04360 [Erysipelotrichaceae bacterium]